MEELQEQMREVLIIKGDIAKLEERLEKLKKRNRELYLELDDELDAENT